jgi:flavin reductase (DIM6/NTAB) family NADH-FMN oxidoreductase RutF
MEKVKFGPQLLVNVFPTVLVGVNVDNKPTFMALSWVGIANGEPPMVSIAVRHRRYTYVGIRQNMTFSLNVPTTEIIKETDYCGLVSGFKVNKVEKCKFNVFYGILGNAPLIEQCPVNLECKARHIISLESHALIIGSVEETYVAENCITDGKPDTRKLSCFGYTKDPFPQYLSVGQYIANAISIGRDLAT